MELYQNQYLPTLQKSSIKTAMVVSKLYKELLPIKMIHINSLLLNQYVENKKKDYLNTGNQRRYNFNKYLKCLKAIFNWYKENCDGQFINPVLK